MKTPGPAHRRFGKRRLRMFYRQSQSVIVVTSPKKHQAVQSIASKTNNLCFAPLNPVRRLTKNLYKEMDSLEVRELIVVGIHADTEEETGVSSVDDLVVPELYTVRPGWERRCC